VTFNLGWQADEARKEINSGFMFLALGSLKDAGVLHGHYKPTGNDGDKKCNPETSQVEDDDAGAGVEIVFGPGVIITAVVPHDTEVGTILIADYITTEEAYFRSYSDNEFVWYWNRPGKYLFPVCCSRPTQAAGISLRHGRDSQIESCSVLKRFSNRKGLDLTKVSTHHAYLHVSPFSWNSQTLE
jgi:hypothetical protein